MKAQYLNHYLTDRDVANFARQSFAKLADSFSEGQNNNLIRFLARGMQSGDWEALIQKLATEGYAVELGGNPSKLKELATYCRNIPEHWVPFGHPQITLRMRAPIPIRVQCFKHKIGFVESEESRRYISTTPSYFIPTFRSKAASVKQGSGETHPDANAWSTRYANHCEGAITLYERMLAEGICPEQARFVLPQGCEVNWVWTGSLYAFANFYNQRSDSHAQKEIQDLAEEVNQIIAPLYPVSWKALTQGQY